MEAAIITIGDEILIGQIIDSNSAFIAESLSLIGVEILEIRSISDKRESIHSTLRDFEGKVELVILTGGLGPTRDDITKGSLAEYFNSQLVENQEVLDHIQALFRLRGFTLNEINRKQALIPENCTPLRNVNGTAPGMWFERTGTIFISLPGVPYEMKEIVSSEIIPKIAARLNGSVVVHKTIMTQGIPESMLAARIKDWELGLPGNLKLAYLPRPGIVRLRLTAKGINRSELEEKIEMEIEELTKIIPDDIFGFNDESLEEVIGKLLAKANRSLAIAESCTGGNLAYLITSVPGSSLYFKGGCVAYSNDIKIRELDVPQELIEAHGAVSKEVVEAMALNISRRYGSDYGLATSGIAGPGGGTREKPVGTVWIAISKGNKVISQPYNFGENRLRTVERASYTALSLLRKLILDIL